MKILITGASGQLGKALLPLWDEGDVSDLDQPDLDVRDSSCVENWFATERPDWVVHCAAMTDTAACERDPARAIEVNTIGTGNIARACATHDARLIAISTNEVFHGSGRYSHSDPPILEDEPLGDPINLYGASKHAGEELAAAVHADTLIVRTAFGCPTRSKTWKRMSS